MKDTGGIAILFLGTEGISIWETEGMYRLFGNLNKAGRQLCEGLKILEGIGWMDRYS